MDKQQLVVHPDGHYLMWQDGQPFFYLADTAWELFHKLDRDEAAAYLHVRANQGFRVIQAVALAEYDGLQEPNAYGRVPLLKTDGNFDPARPDQDGNYSYWNHVDYIVRQAARHNLFVGLLPTWGDKFNRKWGIGPEIFTPENADAFASFLARRYADDWNIIWILGGDRPLETMQQRQVIDAMGRAVRNHAPRHLITYHPMGGSSSADHVAGKDYIDFHMIQSGHALDAYQSFQMLRQTGEREAKPFLDGEPRYEGHPACFKAEFNYLWQADDVRQNAWWNLMEGVCGHTYGHHAIWYFNCESEPYQPHTWQAAMHHPAAAQMVYLARLRYSRPYFQFRPAPELVESETAVMARQAAGRGDQYAYIYSPLGLPIRAHLKSLGGQAIRAAWYNPRNGLEAAPHAVVPADDCLFVPPASGKGQDWVLVLDVMS